MNRIAISLLAVSACTDPQVSSTESAVDASAFVLPSLSTTDRAQIVHKYDALDPGDEVPRGLLEDAIVYFDYNKPLIPKQSYFVVVDFSLYSGKDRFWMVDLAKGTVESHKVAHGDGTDPDNDGFADVFGNVDGSHMSSLGFYLTGEIYDGTHVHSMRLDGLSPDGSPNGMADTNVRERLIVVHEASYVSDSNTSQQGRSNGCLALDPSIEVGVVDRIHDGTLIYADTKSLNAPVGRAQCGDSVCDGAETHDSCPADCAPGESGGGGDPPSDGNPPDAMTGPGGCSATGGAGIALAFAALGLRRRKR